MSAVTVSMVTGMFLMALGGFLALAANDDGRILAAFFTALKPKALWWRAIPTACICGSASNKSFTAFSRAFSQACNGMPMGRSQFSDEELTDGCATLYPSEHS